MNQPAVRKLFEKHPVDIVVKIQIIQDGAYIEQRGSLLPRSIGKNRLQERIEVLFKPRSKSIHDFLECRVILTQPDASDIFIHRRAQPQDGSQTNLGKIFQMFLNGSNRRKSDDKINNIGHLFLKVTEQSRELDGEQLFGRKTVGKRRRYQPGHEVLELLAEIEIIQTIFNKFKRSHICLCFQTDCIRLEGGNVSSGIPDLDKDFDDTGNGRRLYYFIGSKILPGAPCPLHTRARNHKPD